MSILIRLKRLVDKRKRCYRCGVLWKDRNKKKHRDGTGWGGANLTFCKSRRSPYSIDGVRGFRQHRWDPRLPA